MTEIIVAAVVSGGVSIIVSLVSFISIMKKSRDDLWVFKLKLNDQYKNVLYEKRLKHYPEAFTITDKFVKNYREENANIESIMEVDRSLREWKSGIVNLIISEDSLIAYYNLINCFKARPAKGSDYNNEQIQRMYKARTAFRNALRNDVYLLHDEIQDENKMILNKEKTKKIFKTWDDLHKK